MRATTSRSASPETLRAQLARRRRWATGTEAADRAPGEPSTGGRAPRGRMCRDNEKNPGRGRGSDGADDETRTRDPNLGKVMRYQLRYIRIETIGLGEPEPLHSRARQPLLSCTRARYWDRTSDLFRVREARYRCANRALSEEEPCPPISEELEGLLSFEVTTGFEPVYAALQAAASPLGHVTVLGSCPPGRTTRDRDAGASLSLERMTRLELATLTLARLCATNCATSAPSGLGEAPRSERR